MVKASQNDERTTLKCSPLEGSLASTIISRSSQVLSENVSDSKFYNLETWRSALSEVSEDTLTTT
jgi:hypothetical protein